MHAGKLKVVSSSTRLHVLVLWIPGLKYAKNKANQHMDTGKIVISYTSTEHYKDVFQFLLSRGKIGPQHNVTDQTHD